MNILTRDFGEIDVAPEDIITFSSPMFGFEDLKKYIFLFAEENTHIVWLQSVENPHICFILADPRIVEDNYAPHLSADIRSQLGEGEYLYWLVVVVDLQTKKAVQTILEEDYPLRRPLAAGQEGR